MVTRFTRRQRCSSMLCLRSSASSPASPPPVTSRKRRSLGDFMKRPSGGDICQADREFGDPAISFPWNFQHYVHVDESLNGLPPSWAAQLSTKKGEEASPTGLPNEKKFRSPVSATAQSLRDVDPNADAHVGLFCFGSAKAISRNTPVSVVVPPAEMEGDPGISAPWGFKHNIHVDENYTGLPSDWSNPIVKSNIDKLLDMSPDADGAISTPWNFRHNIHAYAGMDGLPRGLPPSFSARLSQVGYSEGEIAAISAAS